MQLLVNDDLAFGEHAISDALEDVFRSALSAVMPLNLLFSVTNKS